MKKTVQVHIGGRHFQIDEDAYQKLKHYLAALKAHFAADGETGLEIVEDIEQRVAELLENKIVNGNQAITLGDVNETIAILGKVEDFVYAGEAEYSGRNYDTGNRKDNRRLYRDPDNRYLGGVASGLGEYFDIDPLWMRLSLLGLVFFKGLGLLIYVILWIVVPKARNTAEKLQMRGKPVNLSTIKDSVTAEFDKVKSSAGGFGKSPSADRTRNALENLMRAFGLVILAVFKFFIVAIGILFLVIGSVFLAILIMVLLGFTNVFGHIQLWDGINMPDMASYFTHAGHYYLVITALAILVIIPIAALIYGGIKILFNIKGRHPLLWVFLLIAWILSLVLIVTLIVVNAPNSSVESSRSSSSIIQTPKSGPVYIDVRDNTESKRLTHYQVFGLKFNYSDWDESLYDEAQLQIAPSADNQMHITVGKRIKNVDLLNSREYFDEIDYAWELKDSALYLDKYFNTDDDDFWMFAKVNITLGVPEGQVIEISQNTCDLLVLEQRQQYCNDSLLVGKNSIMTADGLRLYEKQKTRSIGNK